MHGLLWCEDPLCRLLHNQTTPACASHKSCRPTNLQQLAVPRLTQAAAAGPVAVAAAAAA